MASECGSPTRRNSAFSGQLASHFLAQEIWTHEVGHTGTEIALTISAITGGFRLAQSFLGVKPHVDARSADLVAAMRQTVGALFWSLEPNFSLWSTKADSQPVPTLGGRAGSDSGAAARKPQAPVGHVSLRRGRTGACAQIDSFPAHAGRAAKNRHSRGRRFSVTETSSGPAPSMNSPLRITRLSSAGTTSSRRWPRFIADGHLLFWSKTAKLQREQVEQNVENFCLTCERLKPSLLELWNGRK